MKNKKLMFFPQKEEDIECYVEQILHHVLKDNYDMEKLLLYSFIKMSFDIKVPEEELCPASILFLLEQTNEGDNEDLTLVDRMFMVAEQMNGNQGYQNVYWYLKETEDFVPSIIRLISVFQFYSTYFPEPVYSENGKELLYYPNTMKNETYEVTDGVERIHSHAFHNNQSLKIIKFPKTLKAIGKTAITNCKQLHSIIVDENNEIFYSKYGVLYKNENGNILVKYPSGKNKKSITIPKDLTLISSFAFEKCQKLESVSIESSSTELEDCAFTECTNLNSIMILDGNLNKINPRAFDNIKLNQTAESDKQNTESGKTNLVAEYKTPSQINSMFNEYIVGHEEAKKTLSVAVYSHIMRCNNPNSGIGKSNILICGPTGCGKTEFARTIAKCMNVPFVTVDATSITETGMKGSDPTDMLKDLLVASNNQLEVAQRGIIYIDEIDKLAIFGENAHRESYSKGVQQGLLKIVEGGIIPIRIENPLNPSVINFDTSNVLFIAGGAFSSITSENDPQKSAPIGFNNKDINKENSQKKLNAKDFIKYGMTQEFIGRFPVIVQLHQLTEEEIYRIMIEPKNSVVEQYKKLVQCMGSELNFDDELLHSIAKDAIKNGTGARGLRAIIEALVENIIYELPDKKNVKSVVVHQGMIENHETAKYITNKSKTPKQRKRQSSNTKIEIEK